jgi:hypothetical protein
MGFCAHEKKTTKIACKYKIGAKQLLKRCNKKLHIPNF